MGRDTKTYKGNKRDQYTIVLEDLRSKFEVFGEGLQFLNFKFDRLESKFEHLDRKVDVLTFEVKEIKTILHKHDDKFYDHEERIDRLENS